MRGSLMALTGLAFVFSNGIAFADELDPPLTEIVVTPARAPTRLEDVGNSLTVIDSADLDRREVRTLPEALTLTPGVDVTQLGGIGHQTSVFTRGADPNETLVLIDGQPYVDPSSPNGAFNIGNLPVVDIDRVEVVRGAQSALYGSQAGAGVINIITAKPTGNEPHAYMQTEGGSFGTVNEQGQFSQKIADKVGMVASFEHLDTGGFDLTPPRYNGGNPSVPAFYRNTTGSLTLTADLADNVSARAYGQAIEAKTGTQPTPEDPNADETQNRYFGSFALAGKFFDAAWLPTLTVNLTQATTHDQNAPDPASATESATINRGSQRSLTFVNEIDVVKGNRFLLGLDATRNTLSSQGASNFTGFVITEASSAVDHNVGIYAEDIVDIGRLGGTVGFRFDNPDGYAARGTYHIAPILHFDETGTRLKASVGTGYRTPSLFERFGYEPNNFGSAFTGNASLKPETTRSRDIGFEQDVFGRAVTFGATYFRFDADNAVTTVFDNLGNSTSVNNVNERSRGAETFIAAQPWETVTMRLNYTYTEAVDRDAGTLLLRRPRHKADYQLTWQPSPEIRLTGIARYVGRQQDIGLFGGTVYDRDYVTADLTGSWDLTPHAQLFARIVNLADERYEVADGFAGQGRSVFGGLRLRF